MTWRMSNKKIFQVVLHALIPESKKKTRYKDGCPFKRIMQKTDSVLLNENLR